MASNNAKLPRFISRPIIRHAFDGALNSCARLNNFATGSSTGIGDELVDFRAQKLALDDLTSFALHARRLIQTSGTRGLISKTAILGVRNGEKEQLPLVEVISTIVHGDDVHIIRTDFDAVVLHSGDPLGALAKFGGKKPTDISRVILIFTAPKKSLAFKLLDLTSTFEEKILTPIVAECAKHRFYLDPDWDSTD